MEALPVPQDPTLGGCRVIIIILCSLARRYIVKACYRNGISDRTRQHAKQDKNAAKNNFAATKQSQHCFHRRRHVVFQADAIEACASLFASRFNPKQHCREWQYALEAVIAALGRTWRSSPSFSATSNEVMGKPDESIIGLNGNSCISGCSRRLRRLPRDEDANRGAPLAGVWRIDLPRKVKAKLKSQSRKAKVTVKLVRRRADAPLPFEMAPTVVMRFLAGYHLCIGTGEREASSALTKSHGMGHEACRILIARCAPATADLTSAFGNFAPSRPRGLMASFRRVAFEEEPLDGVVAIKPAEGCEFDEPYYGYVTRKDLYLPSPDDMIRLTGTSTLLCVEQ